MILSRYSKIFPSRDYRHSLVLFSTKKASIIRIPKTMIEDIEAGRISDVEWETLVRLGFLVESPEDEKDEILHFMDRLNSLDKVFKAVVVMNLDCNLACTYCFEGKRKGKHYMTQETADRLVEFVRDWVTHAHPDPPPSPPSGGSAQAKRGREFGEKRSGRGLEEISLIFYGGEPLLSTELIISLSEQLKALAHERGLLYRFSLITNGALLTRRAVERLKPLGLQAASVTLDGHKRIHNRSRPFTSGRGSFDAIVKNITDVCNLVDIQIGGNFTRENYTQFPLLLDYLRDHGLGPDMISEVRFDPVFRESPEFALPHFHSGCVSINEPWLFEAGVFLREEILKRGYRAGRITPTMCMIEQANGLVINYDGAVYKCPGLIGRQTFCVGDLKTGVRDYAATHNLDNYKNKECLDCTYLPLCFGGCRYMKLLRDGHVEGVDCRKAFYDATIETLAHQDIRYPTQSTRNQA